jgi:AcrR family transcriptional regulator
MPKKKVSYHHGDLKNALIEAGADILSKEGMGGLSLRKVALRAGVSHAAPYAHFADKDALVAAIATEGYRRLYEAIDEAARRNEGSAAAQLVQGAWAYVDFALSDRDYFRVTMSGAVERQKEYPAYVEMSQKSFALVVRVVEACQRQGILGEGPPDLVAVSVWSLIHGFVSLLIEDQISHVVLDRFGVRGMLLATLNQLTRAPLDASLVPDGSGQEGAS